MQTTDTRPAIQPGSVVSPDLSCYAANALRVLWCPVAEGVPHYTGFESPNWVLGWVRDLRVGIASAEIVVWDGVWRDQHTLLIEPERGREITHWMPLPASPRPWVAA